jgi:hypothetical protein
MEGETMPDYDAYLRSKIDPDAAALWDWRLGVAVAQYRATQISPVVFRAVLYGLGFRGALLDAEFNYHQSNRNDPV